MPKRLIQFIPNSNRCCVLTAEEYSILPRIPNKNDLHEALENQRFEEASRYIGSESEAYLVECFEGIEKFPKSCLHIIAAIRDTEEANKLCRQLLERIRNRKNREYLLNMTTVEEFDVSELEVLPTSGDRPSYGTVVERRDEPSWLRDDDDDDWKLRARVAAIHIAAYNGNPGVVVTFSGSA